MESWHILLILLILMALNYMRLIHEKKIEALAISAEEGFENDIPGAMKGDDKNHTWLTNEELYDSFYCSVYDQLCRPFIRNQAEAGILITEWTKKGEDKGTFRVLDIGCGTGITVCSLAKMGVARSVGLDSSHEMIQWAKTKNMPATTLDEQQKQAVEWREGDAMNPSACSGGEFDHICMLYFTVYYLQNKEAVFRNAYFWTRPGGRMVIQVVNKHKFDPMLESASPWLFFSLQKYSDDRITRSEVDFDKFKYTGDFALMDPKAEFRETFRFKDGRVRYQKHEFVMEDMSAIVGMAKLAGWEYIGNVDLTSIGFSYSYHLHFKRS